MADSPPFDPSRNTLATALSPYLRSHADNPVHWQQWSREACDYALEHDRILFVSVGYSTCHWCHVMAREAFSDPSVAEFLNRHFVSIKVDREERPDIDSYMMNFMLATRGSGGWPLNVFLSPRQDPFFAMTYAPVDDRAGMPGFVNVLTRVLGVYRDRGSQIGRFEPGGEPDTLTVPDPDVAADLTDRTVASYDPGQVVDTLFSRFDHGTAGFGAGPRFPAHSTLLWLLYARDALSHTDGDASESVSGADRIATRLLDIMQQRGLHDHLGGGFFRYCVDEAWTIPHFEKMLYDQAMLLWVYAAAARVYHRSDYARTAHRVAACLTRDFLRDGLFMSAYDADTGHEEGATYLWTREEIRSVLPDDEWTAFTGAYELPVGGNFEGRIHLLETDAFERTEPLERAERRLFERRQDRLQPEVDAKHITHWNALAGIGFAYASRYLETPEYMTQARSIADTLASRHCADGALAHASLDGQRSGDGYLDDYAAFALFLTVLEETEPGYDRLRREMVDGFSRFREGAVWYAGRHDDFRAVPAERFDQPIPSALSMADFALVRSAIHDGLVYEEGREGQPLAEDFRNLSTMLRAGFWHIIEGPEILSTAGFPLSSIVTSAPEKRYCFAGQCRPGWP
ncbi:MAG: thioredoxin domain-containing protein [bacterium]